MTLEEIIEKLDDIDDSLIIHAERSPDWNRGSEAVVVSEDENPKEERLLYFLEVDLAKNVLEAWSYVRDGQVPNLDQKCEAIIYYAENDAYLLPPETD